LYLKIFKKEFLLIGKARNGMASLLTLNLAFLFIFHFAFEKLEPLELFRILGLKWAMFFLLNFTFVGQSLYEERESGAMKINSTILPSHIFFLIKSFVLFIFLIGSEIVFLFLLSLFFKNFSIDTLNDLSNHLKYLAPSILSITFLGVILGQLSQETRLKEMVLPILLIPFSLPIFLIGMEAERNFFIYQDSSIKPLIVLYSFTFFYGSLGVMLQELGLDN
jgi:heme exporter protein B